MTPDGKFTPAEARHLAAFHARYQTGGPHMTESIDPWRQHLEKYGLLELHDEAKPVGYRIRVANGWTFDLEYEGGLAKYHELGIKTFEDTEQGRAEARSFLATVKADISRNGDLL